MGGVSPTNVVAAPHSAVEIDPTTGRIEAAVPLIGRPFRLAAHGLLWVGNDASDTLWAVDPSRRSATKLVSLSVFPSDVATGGAIWILDSARGVVFRVDPKEQRVTGRVRVAATQPGADVHLPTLDSHVAAAGEGSIWTTDASRLLTQTDPVTMRVVRRIDLGTPRDGVTTGDGSVWAISGISAMLFQLDSHGNLHARIPIVSQPDSLTPYPKEVRFGGGFVWVLNTVCGTLTKVDPITRTIVASIHLDTDRDPERLAVADGAAWVANGDRTLTRVDAATNALRVIRIGRNLNDVGAAGGRVWVTVD
jgi:streptogramin lyase